MISEDLSETLIVNVVVRTTARRVIRRSVIATRDPGAAKRLEIDVMQTQQYETKALDALMRAVAGALERKRRLGQYAVVWRGDRPICIGPDAPAEQDFDRIGQDAGEQ